MQGAAPISRGESSVSLLSPVVSHEPTAVGEAQQQQRALLSSSLAQFAEAGSWRHVFRLTESIVLRPDEQRSAFFYAVKRFRVLSLVKLRMLKQAADELASLELGGLAPFELRLLHAVVPSLTGSPQTAVDLLYGVLDWLDEQVPDVELERQRRRTRLALVAVLVRLRDLVCAVQLVEDLVAEAGRRDGALLSLLGQLCLELGDIARTRRAYDEAAPLVDAAQSSMNAGLLRFAEGDYAGAAAAFEAVVAGSPESSLRVAAINNRAVCLLFGCDLSGAVQLLDKSLTGTKPAAACVEEVFVGNLCTLIDLSAEKPAERRQDVARFVQSAVGEAFDLSLIINTGTV